MSNGDKVASVDNLLKSLRRQDARHIKQAVIELAAEALVSQDTTFRRLMQRAAEVAIKETRLKGAVEVKGEEISDREEFWRTHGQ